MIEIEETIDILMEEDDWDLSDVEVGGEPLPSEFSDFRRADADERAAYMELARSAVLAAARRAARRRTSGTFTTRDVRRIGRQDTALYNAARLGWSVFDWDWGVLRVLLRLEREGLLLRVSGDEERFYRWRLA